MSDQHHPHRTKATANIVSDSGDGAVSQINIDVSDSDGAFGPSGNPPSTTTISTIAVQAGEAKIVLAILRSSDFVRVRIQQMEPDLMEIGTHLNETIQYRNVHEELISKLKAKQDHITELLTRADDLVTQHKSYNEVYEAMARSLGEAWKELNLQLECRRNLINQAIRYHTTAERFNERVADARTWFTSLEHADFDHTPLNELLDQHDIYRKHVLEASLDTLNEGQILLEHIRQMSTFTDNSQQHSTLAGYYEIEHLLSLHQDKRCLFEDEWEKNRQILTEYAQMSETRRDIDQIFDWLQIRGQSYLENNDLGRTLDETERLQMFHSDIENESQTIHDRVLHCMRAVDSWVHTGLTRADRLHAHAHTLLALWEKWALKLDLRRKLLTLTKKFYIDSSNAYSVLDSIDVHLLSLSSSSTTNLPRSSEDLTREHTQLNEQLTQATDLTLREGHILLERTHADDVGARSLREHIHDFESRVRTIRERLSNESDKLERQGSSLFQTFDNEAMEMQSWLYNIVERFLITNRTMGGGGTSTDATRQANDFFEAHQQIIERDFKRREEDIHRLGTLVHELQSTNDRYWQVARSRYDNLFTLWQNLSEKITRRYILAQSYVDFRRQIEQLTNDFASIDNVISYRDNIDLLPESAVKHIEETWSNIRQTYQETINTGKRIRHAFETEGEELNLQSNETYRSIIDQCEQSTRRYEQISSSFDGWFKKLANLKDFKHQWHQFVQDARSTIDKVYRFELNIVPTSISTIDNVEKYQRVLSEFATRVQEMTREVEDRLRTAEQLGLRGETNGQKEQIVNELIKAQQHYLSRVNQTRSLLHTMINFHKNYSKLDTHLTSQSIDVSSWPTDIRSTELLMRQYQNEKEKIIQIYEQCRQEAELADNKAKQAGISSFIDEIHFQQNEIDNRYSQWQRQCDEQNSKLKQRVEWCQFLDDKYKIVYEIDSLQQEIDRRKRDIPQNYKEALVRNETVQEINRLYDSCERAVRRFRTTAEVILEQKYPEYEQVQYEMKDVEKKLSIVHVSVGDYRHYVEKTTTYYKLIDEIERWHQESSQLLIRIGSETIRCQTEHDASELLIKVSSAIDKGKEYERETMKYISTLAVEVFGPDEGHHRIKHVTARNIELINAFIKVHQDISIVQRNFEHRKSYFSETISTSQQLPSFGKPLRDATATEGTKFTFECIIDGSEPIEVTWFKNRTIVSPLTHDIQYERGLATMTLADAQRDDSAYYTCRATNTAGSVESSAYLIVKAQPTLVVDNRHQQVGPTFVEPLRSIDARIDSTVIFECIIRGEPTPRVIWEHDGIEICEGDSSSDAIAKQQIYRLTLRHVQASDGGKYACKATNIAGQATSVADLRIHYHQQQQQQQQNYDINMLLDHEPRLTEPLKATYVIREGQPVKLSCRFEASPKAEIQWLKDGIPIDFAALGISRDFTIVKEIDYTALLIKEGFPEDTGSYTVVIRNSIGEARSFTQLSVEEYFCRTPESEMSDTPCKPVFVQPLRDTTIIDGQKLKLHAAVNANPEPEIIWYHNGTSLKNSRDVIMTFDGQLCTLTKDRCQTQDDSGTYRITAVNSMGHAESVCQVTIRSPDHPGFRDSRLQSVRSTPIFLEQLQEKTMHEGERLLFQVRVSGQPKPQIVWYKDNQPLRNTHDHKIRNQDDVYTLEIPELFLDDAGFYLVKAINVEGEAKSSAKLNIVQTMAVPSGPTTTTTTTTTEQITFQPFEQVIHGSPPEFLQLFTDRQSTLGSTITFEARVLGTPPLNIYWLFNGLPISKNTRFQQQVNNNIYTLTIRDVHREDAGRFTLNAENSFGKATCTAELFLPMTPLTGDESNINNNMLSDRLVEMSPSPPLPRKRHIEISQQHQQQKQQQEASSSGRSFEREYEHRRQASFSSSGQNKRYRPLRASLERTQSLSRDDEHHRRTAYPTSIDVFVPYNVLQQHQQKQQQGSTTTTTRSYEYEAEERRTTSSKSAKQQRSIDLDEQREYLRCLHDLTTEFEKAKRLKKSSENRKKKTTIDTEREEEYESIEEVYHRKQPTTAATSSATTTEEITQHSTYRIPTTTTQRVHQFQQQFRDNFSVRPQPVQEQTSAVSYSTRSENQQRLSTAQRSFSEEILYRRLIPSAKQLYTTTPSATTSEAGFATSEDDLTTMEYRLQRKERLKPIRIHASTSSIPGETSIKYVRTERAPIELLVPKPQIVTTPGEHSSTIVKDVRRSTGKITQNLIEQQQHRRTTIEGEHELRVISEPISAGQTRPVEFTVQKPIETVQAEHTSTFVVESKKGGRFQTLDVSSALTREHTLAGEHELRVVSEPISAGLHNKAVELLFPKPPLPPPPSHHSSTVVKHTRRPMSSLVLDNIQTTLKGEHELRLVEQPVRGGPPDSVELIIPKSVTDTAEHTTTIVTETQPHRRVLEITGSGRTMEREHETRFIEDIVRVEEELELKLPKQRVDQAGHSTTIVKHSRGRGPIIEVDTTRRPIEGEHETRIIEESIETRADAMQLLIAKPQIPAEHSTTVVKEQRGKPQVFAIDRTQPIPGEHQTKYYDRPVEALGEMQVVFPKHQPVLAPQEGEHMATLVKQVHARQVVYDDRLREIPGEHILTVIDSASQRVDTRGTESEVEFIVPKPQVSRIEEHSTTVLKRIGDRRPLSVSDYDETFASSAGEEEEIRRRRYRYDEEEESGWTSAGEHTTTYVKQARAKFEPVELVVDRPKIMPSIARLIADIQGPAQITSIRPTQILIPQESSVKLDLDLNSQNEQQFDEMEIVLEKPLVRDSSMKLLANIQPGLEVKSIRPTAYQQQTTTVEESSSILTMQMQQQEDETVELRIRKPHIQDSSSVLLASVQPELGVQGQIKASRYIQPTIEESSTAITMDLNRDQSEMAPVELIIPRIGVESSTSTILAQIAPTLAGIRAKVDVPPVEKSTSKFVLEQKKRLDEEVELIMPKPKKIETSTTTIMADVSAKLETRNIRPSQVQPETSTSTYYFAETREDIVPEAVEIRIKQPPIADSSTTLFANVKATLDTHQLHMFGNPYQPIGDSSSAILLETSREQLYPPEVELILPRPHIQESTSVVLADVRPTLDTSQTHVVIAPPFQPPIQSSSQLILSQDEIVETTPVELYLHRQPSSHTLVAKLDDARTKNKEMYVLGTGNRDQQYSYGQVRESSSTLHADLNKPVELILDVGGGVGASSSFMSDQQQRREFSSRMLTSERIASSGVTDNSSTFITELEPRQYEPIEFIVSGGLTGYNNTLEQYSSGGIAGRSTTTTTTTKRTITSSDGVSGYNETKNASVIRGVRPFDQVDLVLQPEGSISSTKILTTKVGLDQGHAPYFVLSLRDQTTREGEPVLFEIIISAQPSAEILWDKDGDLIGDDSAFRVDYYGDGRATLYIPETFLDDQGYYTCTATNTLGTCRSTARLTVDSYSGQSSPTRRQFNGSSLSTVQYQQYQQPSSQLTASYHISSQSPLTTYQQGPETVVTEVTEETNVFQIPSQQQQQQQQQNEITYNIIGQKPKFEPVTFQVSAFQENIPPPQVEDENSGPNPFKKFGAKQRVRPTQGIVPSYQDDTTTTTTTYSQHQQYQPQSSGLIATVAKQPGPTLSHQQQQPVPRESDSVQTGGASARVVRASSQQTSSSSFSPTRPNFSKPLESINAIEEETIQLTVHLNPSYHPEDRAQIQWYHHAQPVIPDNRHYRIIEDYDKCTLEIINIKKSDAGQVWCVATSPAGSATTTCSIKVQNNNAPTYYQQVPQEHHATHAEIPLHQQHQQVPYQSYTAESQIPLQQQQSPHYQQVPYQSYPAESQIPLRQQPAPHYQQVPYESYPTGSQIPLQQQQQKLPYTTQPHAPQPQTTSQPFIPPAPPLLPNFDVRPHYSDQQVKFLNNGLQDQPLHEGAETVFECQFTGQPSQVQWFRNNVEIINNPQILNNRIYHVTNSTNGTSRLIIKMTLPEDVGTYSVKLIGPQGTDEETSNAKLIPASQFQALQKKKVDQIQRKALVQELAEKQQQRMQPLKKTAPLSSVTSYGTSDDDVFFESTQRTSQHRQPTAPTLNRPFKDVNVEEGKPIQLTCQIQGFPKCELIWFKNSSLLPLSQRHKVAYDVNTGNITLRISDSRPEDSGIYTLVARNPLGHVQTSAGVEVHPTPGIDETSYVQPDAFRYIEAKNLPTGGRSKARRESDVANQQHKPAKILKTPTNTIVTEGEVAQFICQVEGNPKPKVAWLKDSKPLMAGPRFTTYFDQATKTAVLRITDVCKDDQAYYTCVVDNPLNSDRSTATLQVRSESKVDHTSYVERDAFKYLPTENKQLRNANKENDRRTSGVESESIINPEAFRFLEGKKQPLKDVNDNLAIDDRPIIDTEAFRYLEARQANKGKQDDIRASIDDSPIVPPEAFRYLERKADNAKMKKDEDTGPLIDETPQVNLTAFQYLERKPAPKKPDEGPNIDESSIVNPEAFKYLERKPTSRKPEEIGPLVDESPMVNLDAFRYLERPQVPRARDTTPSIDTTPLVNPDVFKYLERPTEMPRIDEGPSIDTRPIVPQEAFRWLDRPAPVTRAPEGPSIDESFYVNPQAFRFVEAKPQPKMEDQGPAIDERSYVNPQAFRYLESAPRKTKVDQGPNIDTSNYVNPQLFAQFEDKPSTTMAYDEPEVTRAPRILQPLRSTQISEGQPIALVALVDGYPAPQFIWLKDGVELPASNRIASNYDISSKAAWIRLDSSRPDDSAVYTLLAHNPAGQVRSDARLNVVPSMRPVDETPFVPAEAFAKIERASAQTRPREPATTGVDDTAFVSPEAFRQFEVPAKQPRMDYTSDELVVQVPPRILVPLKNMLAPESVTVVLEATIEGSPVPTFTWLKNQVPLNESNRFVTNYDLPSKRVTLTIRGARDDDTGTYTVLASSGPHLEHSSAFLQIVAAPSIDQSSFIPFDVFSQLERPSGSQTQQIPVQSGVDQTSFVAQPGRFAVFDQIRPHQRPLNDFSGVDESPLVSMEKIRLLEIPSGAMRQPYDIEEKLQAPTVLAPLQSIDVQEGSPIVLTAKIDGSPMPDFVWFKNKAPLVASSRFTTYYDIPSKLIVFQIGDARPDDSGLYTVRADNRAGSVSTSAQLNVASLPSIRDQSFVSPDKFRLLDQPQIPRYIQETSGVDDRPLVDLTKLQQLEIKPARLTEDEQGDMRDASKPIVRIPLRNVQAVENQPVVLSAQVEGKPQPQFVWFKNNQPLPEGNRFRTHYDIPSKTIFLTIGGTREDDSGIYRLVAKNPIGQDETSCEVYVDMTQPAIDQRSFVPQGAFDKLEYRPSMRPMGANDISGVDQSSFFNQDLFRPFDEPRLTHPSGLVGGVDGDAAMPISAPRVLAPLRPVTIPEGETVLFTTQVEGYPLPEFTWYHRGQPLMASNRVTSHYDMLTKRCFLQILDTRPDDAGTYELIAENPAGSDRVKTELTVVPVSTIDRTGYVPYDKFSTLEFKPRMPSDLRSGVDATPFVSGEVFRLLEAKPIRLTGEHYAPDDEQRVPLEVVIPLKPAVAQEGQPVMLTTKIRGRPVPEFTWLRNNQPLLESNRFQTHYDFPSETLVLEISNVWPHDSGLYSVIAQSPSTGERVETSAPLTIRSDVSSIDRTPFVAPDAFRTLEAAPMLRTVMVESGVDTGSFVNPDVFRNLDQGKPKRADVPEKEQPLMAPRVIVPLQPVNCKEGQSIVLTAKVEGNPQPVFTWYKNGQPLQESNRFWSHYDVPSKTVILQINGVRPDDGGTYVLVAENPLGHDQTQTTVNISFGPAIDTNAFVAPEKFAAFDQPHGPGYPPAGIQSGVDTSPFVQPERFALLELRAPMPTRDEMEQMEAPRVIVPLQSIQLNEGAPALLQATIVGKPQPNFVWLKDGAPLAASNRLRTRYDIHTKQVLLQINDVRPSDIGEYLVIATNPAGEDSTVCSLSVLPDSPGVDQRAFVPSDKFRDLETPAGQLRRPLEIIPGVDTQPFVSPEKFRNLNEIPPMIRPEEGEIQGEMRPPRVLVPLVDTDLEELMPVLLTATIDAGTPMATFVWHKNGQPLLEGNRFTTKFDIVTRTITLQILAARPDDHGTYTVRATNPAGSDETTCKLTIRPVSSIDTRPFVDADRFRPFDTKPQRPLTGADLEDDSQLMRPPKVIVPMNNVRLTEYQPVILTSVIDAGYPMGKFTWLKDGRPLVESNRYRANFDLNTRTAVLHIDAARPATDTGRYTVHVENVVGRDSTTGDVHVEGTPAVDERPFIEPGKFGKFEGPQRGPGGPRGPILQPDDSLKNRENLAPWIRLLKKLDDQLLNESQTAQLVCVVDAHPKATITWYKDDQSLIVSQRFMPDYDVKTGVVNLTIYPAYASDAGQYTMVARNIAGEVSTRCTLRIQATANIDENPLVKFAGLRKTPHLPTVPGTEASLLPADLDDGQKPYFKKIPPNQEVPEGHLVRFDYIPAGRPAPSLTWFRNGILIRPDDADHREVVNEGGLHSLLVLHAQLGPPVEYTCMAKNKFGEASFDVQLNVVERGSNIAPFFIEQLYDLIIIEGQDAQLEACAQGYPEPKVTWEKEGRPLTPNKEYKVEFEGPKTTLYIRTAKMSDAGWYQCTATSIAGTAVTRCRVTVIPLSQAGQYANEAQFGPQLSKIPTLPENDTRSKYMTIPVKPPEVRPEELYKLPKRVRKPDHAGEEPRKGLMRVLPDEVLAALQKGLEEFPEEEMYSKDRPQPPKFKVHIKSHLNLNEDDPCTFEAKLIPVNDPNMRLQWFKNGKVLHHASKIIPRYDFADVSLEFLWTYAEDDGIYECVATNPYGEDRTRAELKCRPKRSIIYNTQLPEGMEGVSKLQMLEEEVRYTASMIGLEVKQEEKEPKAPEFIMPLEDVTVEEGDNAKFMVKVDGHPRPRVTWSINGSDIFNGSRYKLVYDGLVHYLDIPKTRQYDNGIVRCIAKNSLGQTESSALLQLRFKPDYRSALSKSDMPGGIDIGLDNSFDVDIEERLRLRSQARRQDTIDERARHPSQDKPLHLLHGNRAERMSWHQTVEKAGDAPNFTKSLLPLKAKEGSKVVVSVEFTGNPIPTVSWYRDGFAVEDSEDFKIHTTENQSTLTIKHAFIIDSGLYTVKLFNPIGIKQCQAAIRIMPIIAEDQTPRFLDVPQDTEILSGDPVRFQCRVEGEPFPSVAFYREDEPVDLNDRRFRVIQEGDVFTLLLFEALPADSGQYEAVAENTVGKANTRFTLIVTPRVPGGKKASLIDDPKLIHKVPYLEKPLVDLHVKEGQSATFECIIPASFGTDVKWYKGTSEWAIKPSKFFKPKSDGTKHQLFILEAYAEDEGLYKCVVSNPVGTTATTAHLKVDHSMQVPQFVQGFSNLTTYEGEQVRFEVEVRGDPPPTILWYRDGELIRDSPDFQIYTEGNRSLLYIAEVFMEDQGLFTCTASNTAGSSDCSGRLIVEPRPQF